MPRNHEFPSMQGVTTSIRICLILASTNGSAMDTDSNINSMTYGWVLWTNKGRVLPVVRHSGLGFSVKKFQHSKWKFRESHWDCSFCIICQSTPLDHSQAMRFWRLIPISDG